ncbi:hypothetical protein ACFW2T_19665 [Streptomyces sp. NPDC058892]|uniref:hypothetical protein n=1 Tax=unclassified Streptomyces TaxID=2593676 RepID=UPI00367518D0
MITDFAAAGFAVRETTSFSHPVAVSPRDCPARLPRADDPRPQSQLTCLTAERCDEGLRGSATDAPAELLARPVPVVARYDVVVLSHS